MLFDNPTLISLIGNFQCSNKYLKTFSNINKWINVCKNSVKTNLVNYHYSQCSISTFNDRVCKFFDDLPNICPHLIYLDGPDQFSPIGNVRGVNTNHPDRLPISADILAIEYFLLPGTLIVVDGRTANARFLKNNLQRNWSYYYEDDFDQHYLELLEKHLEFTTRGNLIFVWAIIFANELRKNMVRSHNI